MVRRAVERPSASDGAELEMYAGVILAIDAQR
jgi:hypothetical protein